MCPGALKSKDEIIDAVKWASFGWPIDRVECEMIAETIFQVDSFPWLCPQKKPSPKWQYRKIRDALIEETNFDRGEETIPTRGMYGGYHKAKFALSNAATKCGGGAIEVALSVPYYIYADTYKQNIVGTAELAGALALCGDVDIGRENLEYIQERVEAHRRGYCVECDIDGVLWVFSKLGPLYGAECV